MNSKKTEILNLPKIKEELKNIDRIRARFKSSEVPSQSPNPYISHLRAGTLRLEGLEKEKVVGVRKGSKLKINRKKKGIANKRFRTPVPARKETPEKTQVRLKPR